MNRPWFQFYTRDWLDNKELRRCSTVARAVLTDLMCLAHEGEPYGHLCDSVGPLTDEYMASRCFVSKPQLATAIAQLLTAKRLQVGEHGYFVPRMVHDEEVRLSRAAGGKLGGNPKLVNHEVDGKVNLPSNLTPATQGYPPSRAITRADSGFDSDSGSGSENLKNSGITLEELETAWELHAKYIRGEPKNLAFSAIVAMNGKFDAARFRERHGKYCGYWADAGWQFCPLTLLGWIEMDMPLPPPEPKKRDGKLSIQELMDSI